MFQIGKLLKTDKEIVKKKKSKIPLHLPNTCTTHLVVLDKALPPGPIVPASALAHPPVVHLQAGALHLLTPTPAGCMCLNLHYTAHLLDSAVNQLLIQDWNTGVQQAHCNTS